MTINEFKNFIESLPAEFGNYEISVRSFSSDGEVTYMLDKPIISAYIDEENVELCLLDEENNEYLQKLNNNNEEENTTGSESGE